MEHGQSLSFLQLKLRIEPLSGSALLNSLESSSFHQQQLLFMSWGAASSRLARSDSVKTNIVIYLCTLKDSLFVRNHYLLILSPCPMLAGTPFSMSFSMHFSKAKAATLKKNPCTFSPGNKKNVSYSCSPHCPESLYLCSLNVPYSTSVSSWFYLF